jgi:group I intron endonuclease
LNHWGGVTILGDLPEPRVSGIYLIRNTVNGKVYVGSAVSIYDRLYNHIWHLGQCSHKNRKLQSAWRKHGTAAFAVGVLEIVLDKAELLRREQYWIDGLGAASKGYNLKPIAGSDLGMTRTVEYRERLSATVRAHFLDPPNRLKTGLATKRGMQRPEVREKCRQAMMKRLADPQASAKRSAALYSPEVRDRIAQKVIKTMADWGPEQKAAHSERGRMAYQNMTLEQRARHRLALLSRVMPMASRLRQIASAARRYRVIHPDGRSLEIVNLTAFCRANGVPYPSARNQLSGRVATARGYRFERLVEA